MLHSLISKMFIKMIVAINMQTKTKLKPPKKTRKITNLQKPKRKCKKETKTKHENKHKLNQNKKNKKQIYLPYEMGLWWLVTSIPYSQGTSTSSIWVILTLHLVFLDKILSLKLWKYVVNLLTINYNYSKPYLIWFSPLRFNMPKKWTWPKIYQ